MYKYMKKVKKALSLEKQREVRKIQEDLDKLAETNKLKDISYSDRKENNN